MKAKLVFNLPEDKNEYFLAIYSGEIYVQLYNLDEYLRNKLKYENNLSEETIQELQKVREQIDLSRYDID